MVNWVEVKTGELGDRVASHTILADSIVDRVGQVSKDDAMVGIGPNNGIPFNMNRLIGQLGQVGHKLVQEGQLDTVVDVLHKYWAVTAVPQILVDTARISTDAGEDTAVLRSRIAWGKGRGPGVTLGGFVAMSNVDGLAQRFDRTVIGGDGGNLEVQFLDGNRRMSSGLSSGDLLDPGIFCSVGSEVRVAPGVHRLVCTNGLISAMSLWEKESLDFLKDEKMMDEAAGLMNWMVSQTDKKVSSVREIAVSLSSLPVGFLNAFWKEWAERIELGDLTWYSVIDDVTRRVNTTLSPVRYRALSVAQGIKSLDKGCRCPVCATSVTQGK